MFTVALFGLGGTHLCREEDTRGDASSSSLVIASSTKAVVASPPLVIAPSPFNYSDQSHQPIELDDI